VLAVGTGFSPVQGGVSIPDKGGGDGVCAISELYMNAPLHCAAQDLRRYSEDYYNGRRRSREKEIDRERIEVENNTRNVTSRGPI